MTARARAARHWETAQAAAQAAAPPPPPGPAHISRLLAQRFPRASSREDEGLSGFVVSAPVRTDAGRMVVPVTYHSWDRPWDYSDRWQAHMTRVTRAAFARYARHLRRHGYAADPWTRYDGVQLGLFITRTTD